jgi:hypothetical protein
MMKFFLLWLKLFVDFLSSLVLSLRSKSSLAAENVLSAQTTRVLPGAQDQAPPDFSPNALDPPVTPGGCAARICAAIPISSSAC